MPVRGLRGAITVEHDLRENILAATRQLLEGLLDANPGLQPEHIASAIFTLTPDLTSAFPAEAARQMGWAEVPLMCAQEIPVPGALPHCIRVLIHWNTGLPQAQIQACILRPGQPPAPRLIRQPTVIIIYIQEEFSHDDHYAYRCYRSPDSNGCRESPDERVARPPLPGQRTHHYWSNRGWQTGIP